MLDDSPKIKALNIYMRFKKIISQIEPDEDYCYTIAKECTDYFVKETIMELRSNPEYSMVPNYITQYWLDIKKEVDKL